MAKDAYPDTKVLLARLLPDGVVTETAGPEDWTGELLGEERVCIAGASEKRRREFTAGRVCARRALERLGIRDYPLLPRADRAPDWPADVVGGISHCRDFCVAAVARAGAIAGLGIDVERAEPLDVALTSIVCTQTELARQRQLPARAAPDRRQPDLWKLIFSAKEAFFKCYYPLTQTWLDFKDVEIEFDLDAGTFVARIDRSSKPALLGRRELRGRFAATDRFVFTGICVGPAR